MTVCVDVDIDIQIDRGIYTYIKDMNPILTFPKLKDFNNLTENQLNLPRTHTLGLPWWRSG